VDNDLPETRSPFMAHSYEEMSLQKAREARNEPDPEKRRALRDQAHRLMQVADHYAEVYSMSAGRGCYGC